MIQIIAGLLLWSIVHLIPSLAPALKNKWAGKLGKTGYKLSFSVLILSSIVLMVLGWRSTTPSHIYLLPEIVRYIAIALVLAAFILMGAANYQTRIKHFIRHPQLTGVILWCIAHLLFNGDTRSILLFSGLGIWAILEIIFINRRDGKPVEIKKSAPSWLNEATGIAISLIVLFVFVLVHPYIAGVPVW